MISDTRQIWRVFLESRIRYNWFFTSAISYKSLTSNLSRAFEQEWLWEPFNDRTTAMTGEYDECAEWTLEQAAIRHKAEEAVR